MKKSIRGMNKNKIRNRKKFRDLIKKYYSRSWIRHVKQILKKIMEINKKYILPKKCLRGIE